MTDTYHIIGGSDMRTRTVILIVAALAVVSYLVGYLPERGRCIAAETQTEALQRRLRSLQGRARMAELLGYVLALEEVAPLEDRAQALKLSSDLFDAVRAESASAPDVRLRQALSEVLAQRDVVTAGLAAADADLPQRLADIERRFRRALEYPVPAAREPTPRQRRPALGELGYRADSVVTARRDLAAR